MSKPKGVPLIPTREAYEQIRQMFDHSIATHEQKIVAADALLARMSETDCFDLELNHQEFNLVVDALETFIANREDDVKVLSEALNER